jgi:hypothetical protein
MNSPGRETEYGTYSTRSSFCYDISMSSTTETYDSILAGLSGSLTPQAAEGILALGFSDEQKTRMQELAARARAGELTGDEREEAESFERISSLLGILQSKARMALKSSAS